MRVWFAGSSILNYPVGGHFWAHLNWMLGLQALGCEVVYLEDVGAADIPAPMESDHPLLERPKRLTTLLDSYGGADALAIVPTPPDALRAALDFPLLTIEDVTGDDVLLSRDKTVREAAVRRFRRSAFLDVDPGITHGWVKYGGVFDLTAYDVHFTIGEGSATFADGLD